MSNLEMKISKYLCFMLRHDEKFVTDTEGWASMASAIEHLQKKFKILENKSYEEVENIIIKRVVERLM